MLMSVWDEHLFFNDKWARIIFASVLYASLDEKKAMSHTVSVRSHESTIVVAKIARKKKKKN